MCVGETEKRCPVNGKRYCGMRETERHWIPILWRIQLWFKAMRNEGFYK